ncbi:phage tail protein [Clostridium sp. HBUAS56017]|uniref:phage tail protein n=1 Tax=Clostridium sp. HBUAS56017 TaxID=2571128 RepID=UPI001177424A|nr:phage tail protein [Clostridium sp. HBUAS56017]
MAIKKGIYKYDTGVKDQNGNEIFDEIYFKTLGSLVEDDTSHRFSTDSEKAVWNGKADNVVVTQIANGLMSTADKKKLDGIQTGANVYVHPSSHGAAMITEDFNHRFVTDAEKIVWNNKTNDVSLVGMVSYFAMKTPPAGWIKCNGATISRNTYSRLFSVIGTTFGEGDGKTTFKLPDLRGEFIKGWDDGRGLENGRLFGSWNGNQAQINKYESSGYGLLGGNGIGYCDRVYVNTEDGNYAHPRNVALLACIKY